MKKFEMPEMDIQNFDVEDILTTSDVGGNGDNSTNDDEL